MHVILTHEQADFDALGSLLAAALLNENAVAVLPRRMNRNARAFITLYGAELPFVEARDLPAEAIDTVTLVDTQSLVTLKGMSSQMRVHVVDHHQQRPDLPENWSVTGDRVGACTTLLVENLREHNGELGVIHATLLLLGVYEDTGSLTYASTTPRDVRVAAHLLELGASLRIAGEYLNPPLSAEQRKVYDVLLNSATHHQIQGQHIIIACARAEGMSEEISSVAHKIRDLLDPDALFLLIQTGEGVRLVARSTTDYVDVAQVAGFFKGGGHERAAAALIRVEDPQPPDLLEKSCQELLKILPGLVRPAVTVAQIMSRRPLLLSPQTSVQTAHKLMQRYGFEGFPVVENSRVVGLLTRRAVDRAIAHKLNLTASSLMEAGEVCVHPGDDLQTLQEVMISSGWGQVPVTDPASGEVLGIVTRTDLLKSLAGGPAHIPGRLNLAGQLDDALPAGHRALLKTIADQARQMRMAAYVVGGFARDLLMNRPSLDFDVVVEGDAISLAKALADRFGGRLVAHRRFGTSKWWIADVRAGLAEALDERQKINPRELPASIDLISARLEFYEYPTALPTVERSSIKLDLHRRDFTINTMAIRLDGRHYGDLYDYWGGLSDVRQGLVRVLHSLSFVDDPTRMLRAVRFEQRFGFAIEARTLELMAEARPMMRQVSSERLRHELDLILAEEKAVAMLGRLNELKLLEAIHEDLAWSGSAATRLEAALQSRPDPAWNLPAQMSRIPIRRVLAYLAWLGTLQVERVDGLASFLRFPAVVCQALEKLCRFQLESPGLASLVPSLAAALLDEYPPVVLFAYRFFQPPAEVLDVIERYHRQWRKIEPTIDGHALIARGVQPGPKYRQILDKIRNAWLDGQVKTAAEEQQLLEKLLVDG